MSLFKREIPLVLTFFFGFAMIVGYYLDVPVFIGDGLDFLQSTSVALANFALPLGAFTLMLHHGRLVQRKTPGKWPFSLMFLVLFPIISAIGIIYGSTSSSYSWIYTTITSPARGAIVALPAFYIASAAYRAIRVRSKEAGVMLLMSVLVILGNISLGELIWPGFTELRNWILTVPSTGSSRAITISLGVGSVFYGLRVLLGREKIGFLGGGE